MKASDYIARFLHEQGVTHVFEVVGGMITHMIDSIHREGKIRLVSVHHEQVAAFAADAVGRLTGVPGVAMATSGPGALNLLTGIGSCYFDSSPAVFITGQVNRHELKRSRPIRQLGFQETDIVSIAAPITKAAWRVESACDLAQVLSDAFRTALSGRRGPVLVDIPMDVQRENVDFEQPDKPTDRPRIATNEGAVKSCLHALANAQRPLILVGGGIHVGTARYLFRHLVEKTHVPVVNSLMAVDALPYGHPLRVGFIGSYGNRWANLAIGDSDFLLVLGSRLDIRQTGADTRGFQGKRVIYHMDCESGEINNRLSGCVPVQAHIEDFVADALRVAEEMTFPRYAEWHQHLAKLRRTWPDTEELKQVPGVNPNKFMHALSAVSSRAAVYVSDVGQHQMWAAQSLELASDQHFVTSGGMGAMGFGLPAAIGAAFATTKPVVMIAGDGAFQLNIQELQTVARNRLPLKLVVLNNRCHGMVRQFQESYFEGRYQSTYWGYSAPDFARVAQAYEIRSGTLSQVADVKKMLAELWQVPMEPYLLQVMIDTMANAYPKIAFGHPITEMEPFVKPIAMEGT
jgi:acetolactate synthase-1/2/3 large subunit